MVFSAYRRGDGAFVLVPDCLIASREANATHGPLIFVAAFESGCDADETIWQRVMADIDRQSYAVVRRQTGERYMRIGRVLSAA